MKTITVIIISTVLILAACSRQSAGNEALNHLKL